MTIKTDIAEGMVHKGGTNGTPTTPQPQEPPSLYPSDGGLVYTPVDQVCSECAELRKLLEVAGRMASMVRHIVGGVDFTSGYKKQPVNVTNLGSAIVELRELVDEYDKVLLEDHKRGR